MSEREVETGTIVHNNDCDYCGAGKMGDNGENGKFFFTRVNIFEITETKPDSA